MNARSNDRPISVASNITSFFLGAVVTAIASHYYNNASSSKKNKNRPYHEKQKHFITEEIRTEQLSRNTLYFGENGMEYITQASVLVVGLGGVGSHACHMLARGGIRYLRLVDFDQVTLSSLNRHATATLDEVGIPKVIAMKLFLEKVCPDPNFLQIDARVQMYTGDPLKDGDLMVSPFEKPWDFVVDAIDDVTTKALLIEHCIRRGIRVISCMGAGGKSDITRVHISDLRYASHDPLATKMRLSLKRIFKNENDRFLDDMDKLAVVYSSEKVVAKLAALTEEQLIQGINNFGAMDNMRIRVIPVLGTMPAIMGQSLAAFVLCHLGKKPFTPLMGERVGRTVRHRLFQHFKNRESAMRRNIESKFSSQISEKMNEDRQDSLILGGTWIGPVQIDADDVEYILSEVWRNRCAVTGDLSSPLELVRWDHSQPSDCQNVVVLAPKARQEFDELFDQTGDGRNSVNSDIRSRIDFRLRSLRIELRS